MARLTKRTIDDSKPGIELYFVWDGEVPGFGIMVLPSGIKTYILQYRNEARRSRRLKIGRHGTLTVDEARMMAREASVIVARGGDPAANRRSYREAPMMAELLDRYHREHVMLHNAPSTQDDVKKVIEIHLLPRIGTIKVNDLTRGDVSKLHVAMSVTPRRANYVLAVLSKALSLAELWGLRPQHSNPCIRIRRYPENHRTRFLKIEEVRRLNEVLIEAETIGLPWKIKDEASKNLAKEENRRTLLSWQVVGVIRMLLLTGARLTEITSLKWSEVDQGAGTIALPKKKGGKREPYPASDAAFELLAHLRRIRGSQFVFPRDSDPSRHISKEVMECGWQRIRRTAEFDDVRIHDLRHTVGTYAAQAGVSSFIVRDLLRHTNISTTARYANFDANPVRDISNILSKRLMKAP